MFVEGRSLIGQVPYGVGSAVDLGFQLKSKSSLGVGILGTRQATKQPAYQSVRKKSSKMSQSVPFVDRCFTTTGIYQHGKAADEISPHIRYGQVSSLSLTKKQTGTVLVLALPPTGVDSATLAKLIEIYLSAASFLFLLSLGVGKK